MTYIQANFCNSMVDMDLFFLQICCIQLPPHSLVLSAIESFGVGEWLGMCSLTQPQEMEQDSMLEGLLTFLATMVTSRTNLGNNEKTQCILEISALLATGDKTHSQLLELMPERSGNTNRNFEKYLKELSVFRRPPMGSENLDQGLFMPIPEVWEKHYDPLHVLLRAVHRRDFQNSIDRFQNYVKQEKKMPKSGNLWPPFRIPGPVNPAYSDPSCILHSRIFHAMLLGIFFRAVHSHNVSEHMVALAVFLLELAVTFTENIPKKFALECGRKSNPNSSINEIPELLNAYPGDCLSENLRLHVSRIALTSPEPQVSPANYSNTTFDSDLEWEVSESEQYPTLMPNNNQIDYENTGSRLEVAIPQDLSVVREQSLVLRDQDRMEDDSEPLNALQPLPALTLSEAVQAITEYAPRRSNNEHMHIGPHLALPPTQLPPETGMEVAIRRDLGLATNGENSSSHNEMFVQSNGANAGIMLPFQRVQPVAVPSRNMDMVASTNVGHRRMHTSSYKAKQMEGGSSTDTDSIEIEESILSLLLKLHSKLSGSLDSFSLEDEISVNTANENMEMDDSRNEAGPSSRPDFSQVNNKHIHISESRIGDGPYFVGNLLKKIAKSDANCAQAIDDIRKRLWPNQRAKQAEQKAKEVREKEERSKRARERQQKLMQEFANKQKKFMEQTAEEMECCDDQDEDIEEDREKEYVCIICNRTSPSTESNPIGLVVLVESSGVIGHRRKFGERFLLPLNEEEQQRPGRSVRLATEFRHRTDLLTFKFGEKSWFLTNNNSFESGVHVQSCNHYLHITCHEDYLNSLYSSQRSQNLNVERGEFQCPVCRQLSNSVLPLSPQCKRPSSVTRTPAPPYQTLVSELTTLIKENERPPVSCSF